MELTVLWTEQQNQGVFASDAERGLQHRSAPMPETEADDTTVARASWLHRVHQWERHEDPHR